MARNNNGFQGLEQMDALMKRIERMGKEIDTDLEDKALTAGALVAKDRIENHPNVPVSDESKPHARDHFNIKKVQNGQFDIGIEEEYFYLLFHEIGTEGGRVEVNGRMYTTPAIQAKPFARPAFESAQSDIEDAMAQVIKRELGLS